ncbi:formyltetrahydrofolate deformylase [Gammaproteobacteria bacterium]|jgi:formyltetrahydrofolate deformylase|nr:formyltetrahydrofolate deformylase [Gammaproteobacteria bacterium]MDA7802601.1 formyltetrahydrofolate deformylase [Gammaproteobacteria bacterium]MDA7856189.1 formyltetrahydrofolate deformylase [Gammaproteobacteria bacterium]MDA8957492.1 formyltetrahydrofolate deformylase [Gammaproteobacteria bacterium]MDA9024295.1 formyltetrahydrofolate deformylase [Gammaproteobacteria bacterium]|tara:strand:+ start:1431 stop:2291 length:861 start_codon:yes stop_codon:yes gene_type:complete
MKKIQILTFSCPDQSGIQAKVTGLMNKHNAFLTDVQSYSDKDSNKFFSRIVFFINDIEIASNDFFIEFESLAIELSMKWSIDDESRKIKTVIAVSKEGHCLNDLLYRAKYRDMPIDIVGVVSNHEVYREIVEFSGIKFHYLPIEKNTDSKKAQENEFRSIVKSSGADLIVLARYMQILSDSLASEWSGKCINIHHSFLPSFKGARPYHQAFDKGVKIIGATAHYVTGDLDEGHIIEQDVQRVSHRDSPEDLTRKGNDIESSVLSRAVRWHAEKRILINGTKTIVFN